jgi:hypothetical protein
MSSGLLTNTTRVESKITDETERLVGLGRADYFGAKTAITDSSTPVSCQKTLLEIETKASLNGI